MRTSHRLLCAAASTVLVLVAAPAHAKGFSEVEVTGPGLRSPVVLDLGPDGTGLDRLGAGTGTDAVFTDRGWTARPAAGRDLGPAYVLRWRWMSGGATAVHQVVHPYAAGGPVSRLRTPGLDVPSVTEPATRWVRVTADGVRALEDLGVRRPAASAESVATPGAADTTTAADVPLAAWVVAGLVVCGVAGLVARRRRLSPRAPA